MGSFRSGEGLAKPARTPINPATQPSTNTPTRREFIRSPLSLQIEVLRNRPLLRAHRDDPLVPCLILIVTLDARNRSRVSRCFPLRPALHSTRCRLALRTKIAASAGNDDTPNRRAAPIATFPFSPIGSMAPLIFSRLAIRVKKIGNGRSSHHDGFSQNVLQHLAQCFRFFLGQTRIPSRAGWIFARHKLSSA